MTIIRTVRIRRIFVIAAMFALIVPLSAEPGSAAPKKKPAPKPVDIAAGITDSPDPYSGPDDVADGTEDGITYVVRVANLTGPQATSVVANIGWRSSSDSLPAELEYRSATTAQGSCELFHDPAGGPTLRCSLGTLGPGQVVEIVVNMSACASAPGSADLWALVFGEQEDPNHHNNMPIQSTTVVAGPNPCL